MTIEFLCPFCGKLLKTADEKAGVQANCPGCGEAVKVPPISHEAEAADPALVVVDVKGEISVAREEVDSTGAVAEESPRTPAGTISCPMCGAEIKEAARRCRFCGESLVGATAEEMKRLEAGDILTRSWEIFQKNLGLLVGATVVLLTVTVGMLILAYGLIGAGMWALGLLDRAAAPPPNDLGTVLVMIGLVVAYIGFVLAVNAFMQAGFHILIFKIVRQEKAQISDLLTGSRYFWPLFWGNLLFALLSLAGMVLCFVPYVYIMLIFWPFSYVIVDRKVGVIESFRISCELTRGNLMNCFILEMAAFVIYTLGSAACYVGLIFAIPLIVIVFALTYCQMQGEALAGVRRL